MQTIKPQEPDNSTSPAALRSKANSPWEPLNIKNPCGPHLEKVMYERYLQSISRKNFGEWYASLNRN